MSAVEPVSGSVHWTAGTKIAFRFAASYFLLYVLPFPFTWLGFPNRWYLIVWLSIVQWFNSNLLHRPDIPVYVNGSGDNEWRWAMTLGMLVLALMVTAVWSVADRRRSNYQQLHAWFRVLLRLWLVESMARYGVAKLFQVQYPSPGPWQYLTTYGGSSPMGLLWMFMESSRAYTIFAGAVETTGGLLLILPRLAPLGALVSAAAMANVFTLNLSYDVPVKIRSLHMLLGALFLLAPDAGRLFDIFVRKRMTKLKDDVPWLRGARANRLFAGLQVACGLFMVIDLTITAQKSAADYAATRTWALAGYWRVDEFVLDGVSRQPLVTDAARWERLAIDTRADAAVQMTDGEVIACWTKFDEAGRTLDITAMDGPRFSILPPKWTAHLRYAQPDPDTVDAEGTVQGRSLRLTLRREHRRFLLRSRGFHWVNEFPFNQ